MSPSAALIPVSPHDTGIAEAAALSGRLAYLCLCLTLCWGVLAATGWIRRSAGQDALRGGHVLLAAFALATGTVHGLTFLFLEDDPFGVADLLVPFYDGTPRHALGIAGLELVVAVSVTAALRRGAREGRWLRFHQAGYLAVGLLAGHAWLGAVSSGHLAVVWLAGITLLVPPALLSALRVLPASVLARAGLVGPASEEAEPALRVDVDSQRCHAYGVCQSEAPQVFQLGHDGHLAYEKRPEAGEAPNVRAAARACPMRAIHLVGATR
ncbi:ferredoxin [Amycolatopsis australiensis]|uniref:Ferredoxin n=1 Tax=Amycolatopsis australiensis TaxID=546364 RepID=A0A1K1T7J5_9PSEU|nr:ferredoxin [Amycolatopsis australiensis]SFW92454.1 Ferredoxin [Amycolatopsis australiensis]